MINARDCSEVTFFVSRCFATFPCTSPKSTSLSYSGTIEKGAAVDVLNVVYVHMAGFQTHLPVPS